MNIGNALAGLSLLAAVACSSPVRVDEMSDAQLHTHARDLLAAVPLIDGHNDAPWQYRRRVSNDLDAMDFAHDLFDRNRDWPVIDVTNKAVEETAATILKVLAERGLATHVGDVGQL